MKRPWLVVSRALALGSWGTSVKGNYNMSIGPSPWIVAAFGDGTFSPSSDASGNYEIRDDTVILSGMSIIGRHKVDGSTPFGDRFTFVPCDSNENYISKPLYRYN